MSVPLLTQRTAPEALQGGGRGGMWGGRSTWVARTEHAHVHSACHIANKAAVRGTQGHSVHFHCRPATCPLHDADVRSA